jgi:exonuclease SbcD
MKPFTFIHAADLHLDSPMLGIGRLEPKVQAALRDASLEAYDRLIDLALQQDAAFVVLAGDVFDHETPSLRAQFHLRDGFRRLERAGIRVFWAHGNHDPFDSLDTHVGWPANVTRFPAGHPAVHRVERAGSVLAAVYGISYPTAAVVDAYVRQFVRQDDAPYAVAVLHANVGGQPGHDNYAPASLTELREAGFDYWALGHIHQREVLSQHPPVVYAGNLQGRHVRETGPKGAYVVRVDEFRHAQLEFRALAPVRWELLTLNCDGMQTWDQVEEAALTALAPLAPQETEGGVVVRLVLTGRTELVLAPDAALELSDRLSSDPGGDGPFRFVESVETRLRRPPQASEPEGLWAEVVRRLRGPELDGWEGGIGRLELDREAARAEALRMLAEELDEVEPDAN